MSQEQQNEEHQEQQPTDASQQPSNIATEKSSTTEEDDDDDNFQPLPPPPIPEEVPNRFLLVCQGDDEEGRRRFDATLQWRQEHDMNRTLTRPHPHFELIKEHYPHYYHLRGKNNEPVFYEQPPKTNLQAMRDGGVDLEKLCHHYAMVTEFQWQYIETSDEMRSIYIIDLEGIGMWDFVGECVEYVKRCSDFTGQHYPERAGHVLVINVPGWFQMIFDVIKPMVDEATLEKIKILSNKDEIFEALKEKIPLENIPPEYGGSSVPLGESPQEKMLRDLMKHNDALAQGNRSCGGRKAGCQFCSFELARSY